MHDALAITEADAQGLAEVAEVQLRLARRFAERAEAEEDVDKACRLARASERAARGYRQSLLIKARLGRDADRAAREAADRPPPGPQAPSPQQQARVNQRIRQVYEAVEAIVVEEIEAERLVDDVDALLEFVFDNLQLEAEDPDAFLADDLATHIARTCDAFDLPSPGPPPAAAEPAAADPPPDSS